MGWTYHEVAALPRGVYRVLLDKLEQWAEEARARAAAAGAAPPIGFE